MWCSSPKSAELVAALEAMKAGIDPMTGGALGPGSPPLFGDRRGLGLVDMARAIREGYAGPPARAEAAYGRASKQSDSAPSCNP